MSGMIRRHSIPRRAWSDRAEARTLSLDAAENKVAQKAFRNLSIIDQSQLAHETAHTRRKELCLAYDNVVMVTAGRKQVRNRRTGATRLSRIPCVLFVVRRKWKGRSPRDVNVRQMLPKFLVAYWSVNNERTLCAVPTDVVTDEQFYGVRAESPSGVTVSGGGAPFPIIGNLACAARVTRKNGTTLDVVVSCQHVLSPAPTVNLGPRAGASVSGRGSTGQPIGTSLALGGTLFWDNDSPDVASSFDVQLASLDSPAAAKAAFNEFRLSPARPVLDSAEFAKFATGDAGQAPAKFIVLVPPDNSTNARRVVETEYVSEHPHEAALEYEVTVGGDVRTALIHPKTAISLRFTKGSTQDGDSGSPVVLRNADGKYTFVGMHIGRSAAGRSVMIPAWQLFEGHWYTPKLTSIKPVNP